MRTRDVVDGLGHNVLEAAALALKLYIYGYLNRIWSSRRLEAETHRNIEAIWLLRHLKADFKTIAPEGSCPAVWPACTLRMTFRG